MAKVKNFFSKDGRGDLIEGAPLGSFDYTRQKVNSAMNDMDSFDPDGDGDNDKYNCYIVAMFPDRVVIECGDSFYQMSYSIDKAGKVTLGDPEEVSQSFDAKEALYSPKQKALTPFQRDLKESGIEITKAAIDMDFDEKTGTINARIKEGSFDAATGSVDIIIIEAGTNPLKKRHYPVSTIKESASIFKGMKMYLNHQTEREERERPERDIKDWVSTIQESAFSSLGAGMVLGKAYIHDKQLRENMADKVYAANIGLSINTGGKVAYGKIDGQEMQIVEKINPYRSNGPGSVDWVTEAGARGRVAQPLKESASNNEENAMELKEAINKVTIEELKTLNPALYKQIQEAAGQKSSDEKLAEANRVIEELRKEKEAGARLNKLNDQQSMIKKLLKESKIDDAVRERIADDLKETLFEDETKLKEAVKNLVEKELAYVNKFSKKGKISVGANNDTNNASDSPIKEAQSILEERLGIKK